MPTVPVVNQPDTPLDERAVAAAAPAQSVDTRARQSVNLAEMLAMTRGMPAGERAALQNQILADPRSWTKTAWLELQTDSTSLA